MEEDLKEVLGNAVLAAHLVISDTLEVFSLGNPYVSDLFAAVMWSFADSSSLSLQLKPRKQWQAVPIVSYQTHSTSRSALHLPRHISKPACLEQFVPDIGIPMP
jgi:hypothetical protein